MSGLKFWEDEIDTGFNTYNLPIYMQTSVYRWVRYGNRPDHFLLSILTNNLKLAVDYADDTNITKLVAWVHFCYWHLPSLCWGSIERVDNWKGLDHG